MEKERLNSHLLKIAGSFRVKNFLEAEEFLNDLIDETNKD